MHGCHRPRPSQPWNVRGRTRIGIFAIKDIAFGEALSYDYQFDTNVRTPSRPAPSSKVSLEECRWSLMASPICVVLTRPDPLCPRPVVPRWRWRCQEEDAFTCYCGSENCRGTMAPKKKTDGAGTTKAERQRAIAVGKVPHRPTHPHPSTTPR
jgi:SET domain-containing protein